MLWLAMAEEKYEAITMEVWLCAVNRLKGFRTENTVVFSATKILMVVSQG